MTQQMYFTAEEAAEELVKRQQDQELIAHIEEWRSARKIALPALPTRGPSAFFARQIATCRYEDFVFQNIAQSAGLTPIWIEFIEDKFVASSPYKRSLVHRYYCSGKGRKGGWKVSKRNGINLKAYDGQPLSAICMSDGRSLIEYHHELQDHYLDAPVRQDLSTYLQSIGRSRDFYYPFLSMFLLHGVLVEDFHTEDYHNGAASDADHAFARNVFEPAWQRIINEVGVSPLIVRLPWVDGMQFFPQVGHQEHCVLDCDEVFKGMFK